MDENNLIKNNMRGIGVCESKGCERPRQVKYKAQGPQMVERKTNM